MGVEKHGLRRLSRAMILDIGFLQGFHLTAAIERFRHFWMASKGASGTIFQAVEFTCTQMCHGDCDGSVEVGET